MEVRAARPDVSLSIDANQAFAPESFTRLLPVLQRSNVSLIEQPFPRGRETWMRDLRGRIPLMADESVETSGDLNRLIGAADVINVKLDKTGGFTEALRLIRAARGLGMQLYVGNMFGTSLAMAPACLLGQICDFVELDGPLFLKRDRESRSSFRHCLVECEPRIWGWP